MKTVKAPFLAFESDFPNMEEVSESLDTLARNKIDQLNWKDFDHKPEVEFALAYTDREILLKYYVTEKYFKAEKTETNQNVFEDSCVELFISPEEDGIYYNLEFNGIGTCLMGSGTSRQDRTRTDPSTIKAIRRKASSGNRPVAEKKGRFSWTITIAIPFHVFFHHNIESLRGKTFRANLYKCGDKLMVPHYVTWNPVSTENPDFHRPEFFGSLIFI